MRRTIRPNWARKACPRSTALRMLPTPFRRGCPPLGAVMRNHERRASGRKGASPSLVLRGAVKVIAGLATRAGEVTAEQLSGADRAAWQAKRAELDERRSRRTDRRRFRRNPDAYLNDLVNKLPQSRSRA